MSKRDECMSVPVASTIFTFHVFNIAEGAVAVDVKRGGKTAGKREITFNFYLQATQVAPA